MLKAFDCGDGVYWVAESIGAATASYEEDLGDLATQPLRELSDDELDFVVVFDDESSNTCSMREAIKIIEECPWVDHPCMICIKE